MNKIKDKWACNMCHANLWYNELLTSPNPFENNSEETIYGCPKCKGVNDFTHVCDETNCWLKVTCGCPISKGPYRRTCSKHTPDQLNLPL